MNTDGRRLVIHYPVRWSGHALVTTFHGLPGVLLAPYLGLASVAPLPGVENLVLVEAADGFRGSVPPGAVVCAVGASPGAPLPEGWLRLSRPEPGELLEVLTQQWPAKALEARLEGLEGRAVFLAEAVQHLTEVSLALSAERDHGALLSLILSRARELAGCDAGSLYLVEREPRECLRFVLAQNDSVSVPFKATEMPLDPASLAGYVALTGETLQLEDAYRLPEGAPYSFNRAFDTRAGYLTRSMLVLPMRNHRGDVTGVLQLINRKKDAAAHLSVREEVDRQVIPFEGPVVDLARAVASMAAVAIDNNTLLQNIQNLFEGFVRASVTAIEQRDPTTSGHSTRVALLTVGLAELVDRVDSGALSGVHFTRNQLTELRYASILHDFGKVGVREQVLVKAKKLYPGDLERILTRLETARLCRERELLRRKLALFESGARGGDPGLVALDTELAGAVQELERFREVVLKANEPSVLPEGEFSALQEIARRAFEDRCGQERLLLEPEEVRILSLRKGTLTEEERLEIESHVTHTFHFLSQIPWTPELKGVPAIAYGHHEKLNGCGYPRRLGAPEIPVQSRMMTVSDIFDALSASDRPYKRAVPVDKTLDILRMEAKDGMLDTVLVELFIEGKIFEQTLHLRHAIV